MGVRMMWGEIELILNILGIIGIPVTVYFLWKELTKD